MEIKYSITKKKEKKKKFQFGKINFIFQKILRTARETSLLNEMLHKLNITGNDIYLSWYFCFVPLFDAWLRLKRLHDCWGSDCYKHEGVN